MARFPHIHTLALLLLAVAQPAQAEVSVNGRIAAGLLADDSRVTPTLSGDVRLVLPFGRGPVGFEAGVFGMATDLDTPHETYATLTLDFTAIHLAFGVPRPAFDGVAISPLEDLAPVIGLSSDNVATTRSRATWGAMYGGYLPVGARASGGDDRLQWAISAHRIDNHDLTLLSGSVDWNGTDAHLAAAMEWGTDSKLGGKVAASRDFGRMTAGAAAYFTPLPGARNMAEGFVTWHPMDRLDLTALVDVPSSGDALGVLGAAFGLGERTQLTGALSLQDGQTAASVGVDLRF